MNLEDKPLHHLLLQRECMDEVFANQSPGKHSYYVLRFLFCIDALADEVLFGGLDDTEREHLSNVRRVLRDLE